MGTNEKLADEWKKVGLKLTSIPSGTVFYSGMRDSSPIPDPLGYMRNKHSAWLSQSAYWAGEYCYREGDDNPYKVLIKTSLRQDIDVIEFPSDFHPADAFYAWEFRDGKFNVDYSRPRPDMEYDGSQPDHYIDKHFSDIARLAGYGGDIHGYIRKAENDRLGAKVGEVIELSLITQRALSLEASISPPDEKPSFIEKIGADRSGAGVKLFQRA